MTANKITNEGIVTQLAVVHTMLPKVKELIDQQAQEIAMLKQIIDANNLQSDIGQFVRPIDEPVAWMFEKDGAYMCIKHDNRVNYDGGIPLYTHPAKTLTDEEKDEIISEFLGKYYKGDIVLHQMISAILRKAQEK